MILGFVSAVLEDAGFEEVIDHAAENGFTCVELACWPKGKALRRYSGGTHIDVDGLTEEVCSHIENYCCKKGVEISSLAYYPNMLDLEMENRQFYIGHLKKRIEASAVLKIGMVTTFAGGVPYKTAEENMGIFEEVWKAIIRFAEEKKVRIGSFYRHTQNPDLHYVHADFSDGWKIMKIVEACLKSSRENRWIEIE